MSIPLTFRLEPADDRRRPSRRHLRRVEDLPSAEPPPADEQPPAAAPRPVCQEQPEPPPASAIRRLALLAFEVVEGHRPIAQLGSLVSAEVIDALAERRRARVELRSMIRDRRRVVPTPGRPRLDRPLPNVIEGVVVLQAEPRCTAVAFRLEIRRDRWQATHLTVL
ncbi:Rv3235 family protein [Leucobacter ruminantium]|uniref:3-hydroxyacyl-CoA dehydrogenase n=1 Tax=Leucobacter ruminantium TaxID=1289170 RepID=A0A939LU55_9MICO|nr:Rv3235 family protein [Leucobacter ruminantium]MBO1804829.1 hypothetical protein [Leucobacter ruminantium]